MKFNKDKFIETHTKEIYTWLVDFLDNEVNGLIEIDLMYLLSTENFISFVFEGNKYLIEKANGNKTIRIIDNILKEQGVEFYFEIESQELYDILSEAQEIINETT